MEISTLLSNPETRNRYDRPPNRLRLASFNIQHRRGEPPAQTRERMARIAEWVMTFRPDVLAFQEATRAMWETLSERLPLRGAEYRSRDGDRGEGVPLGVVGDSATLEARESFWLSSTPERPSVDRGAAHPRVVSSMRVEWGGAHLRFLNVHLDHRSPTARRRALDQLRRTRLSTPGLPEEIVVCGDFNMAGTRKRVRAFCEGSPELVDATSRHPLGALRPTFLGWGPFQWARARIDLCLHTPGLRAPEYHAATPDWRGHRLSDHRMVIVDLERTAH